jgi:dipeptidyl-peptidase 4
MGRPCDNPRGYASSNVMNYVSLLTGKLLLVHGGIDENVHFRHTARLIAALTAARKRYELIFFPAERHSPHSLEGWVFMEDQILDFFNRNLA